MLRLPWPGLFRTIRTTKNWYSVLFLAFLLGRDCVAKFRDGDAFVIDKGQRPNYAFIRDMIADNQAGRGPQARVTTLEGYGQVLDLNGCKFVVSPQFSFDSLYLAFFQKWFSDDDLSGYEVIDIGAYDGDTAIYFASKGAIVHAYEPVPEAYAMMQRNIALNQMQETVLSYNCAVAQDTSATMWIDTHTYEGSSSFFKVRRLSQTEKQIRVKSVTIEEALARCASQTKKLLKMNCEGCEFTIVCESNAKLLKRFQKIFCFYHSNLTGIPRESLLEVMQKNGFETIVNESQALIIAIYTDCQLPARL